MTAADIKDNKIPSVQHKEDDARRQSNIGDKVARGIIISLLCLYALSLLVPIFWMLMNSVKSYIDYYLIPTYEFPEVPTFENYQTILTKLKYTAQRPSGERVTFGVFSMFTYSIIWSTLGPVFSIFVTTLAAYVLSRYKFRGNNLIFTVGIVVMILPIVGTLGSAMLVRKALGIYDNMLLMILTGPATAFSGLNFLILYAAFKNIPWAYAEAVFIDGGGHLKVLFSIMLPLVLPTCGVLVLLGAIAGWNDFETFLIWLPSYANIALGLYSFQYDLQLSGGTLPEVLAGFVLVSIPMVMLYIIAQRPLMKNMIVGGLKG